MSNKLEPFKDLNCLIGYPITLEFQDHFFRSPKVTVLPSPKISNPLLLVGHNSIMVQGLNFKLWFFGEIWVV